MITTARLLNKDWEEVWAMPIMLFLNLICYQKDKAAHEENERKKWQKTH